MSDVAELAGVSIMTVSRTLSGSVNVSESMRQKVFAAIAQLRYQPNEVARSLREQRSRQIGIVVPYLFDPFFAICAHAMSTVAKQHSYSVVLATSDEDPQAEFDEASRMLRRNVEGLIVIPAHPSSDASLLLAHEFERIPIVTLDRPIEGSRFDSLIVDNELGAKAGSDHLISLGHKRIAYMGLTNDLYTMQMRLGGYHAAMQAAELTPLSEIIGGSLDDSLAALQRLLALRKPPTALFCSNGLITRNVLHGLNALGLHPPESIALVGFDDFETADLLRPGVTVVRQPVELLGRTAAEVLFSRLAGKHRSRAGKRTVLPMELIIRGSCGAQIRTTRTISESAHPL